MSEELRGQIDNDAIDVISRLSESEIRALATLGADRILTDFMRAVDVVDPDETPMLTAGDSWYGVAPELDVVCEWYFAANRPTWHDIAAKVIRAAGDKDQRELLRRMEESTGYVIDA